MKYYTLIITIILFSCNSNKQQTKQLEKKNEEDKCFVYPSEIKRLQMQDLYDSARWYIYTRYCDAFYKPKSDTLLNKPFGELELKFDNLFVRNDTLRLIFDFIDKGLIILPSMTRDYRQLATGVGFNIKTRKKIYIISSNTDINYEGDPKNRYVNPMQPEVVKYIKEDWDKLNSCFRALANQKGITK